MWLWGGFQSHLVQKPRGAETEESTVERGTTRRVTGRHITAEMSGRSILLKTRPLPVAKSGAVFRAFSSSVRIDPSVPLNGDRATKKPLPKNATVGGPHKTHGLQERRKRQQRPPRIHTPVRSTPVGEAFSDSRHGT
jgi:hypothetical protein